MQIIYASEAMLIPFAKGANEVVIHGETITRGMIQSLEFQEESIESTWGQFNTKSPFETPSGFVKRRVHLNDGRTIDVIE